MKVTTKHVQLPAFLASALINGDTSGLDESDLKWVAIAEKYAGRGRFIDCSDETYFSNLCELPGFNLGADMCEYTIMYQGEK